MTSNNLLNTHSNDQVYNYVDTSGKIVEYDLNRLVFCETVAEKVPTPAGIVEKAPMVNYRINIQDRRPDGKLQDFLVRTEMNFCFGVSESNDQKTAELNGYSLPIALWNQDGATPSQKYFTDFLEKQFLEKCKEHLVASCATFKQPGLEIRDLRKMKIFYRKKDPTGMVNMDDPPTWYPKLIVSKKKNLAIVTRFYQMDEHGNSCISEDGNPIELDANKLIGKWGKVCAVVKIESLYVRSEGISLQCKVWEADYFPTSASLPRMSKIDKSRAVIVKSSDSNPLSALLLANRSVAKEEDVVKEESSTVPDAPEGGDIVPVVENTSQAQLQPQLASEPPMKKKFIVNPRTKTT